MDTEPLRLALLSGDPGPESFFPCHLITTSHPYGEGLVIPPRKAIYTSGGVGYIFFVSNFLIVINDGESTHGNLIGAARLKRDGVIDIHVITSSDLEGFFDRFVQGPLRGAISFDGGLTRGP